MTDDTPYEDYTGDYDTGDPYTYDPADANLPEGHWAQDPAAVQYADQLMTAILNNPGEIQKFYDQYAAEHGLRGLAPEEHKPARIMSADTRERAREFLRHSNTPGEDA